MTFRVRLSSMRLRIVEDLRKTVFAGPRSDLPQLQLAQARYDRARSGATGAGGRQDEAKQYLGALVYAGRDHFLDSDFDVVKAQKAREKKSGPSRGGDGHSGNDGEDPFPVGDGRR